MHPTKEKAPLFHNILTVVGTILCILLTPILLINCTLLAKSFINRDQVPDIGGIFPLIVLTDSMYPEIEGGDLIFCHTAEPEEIRVGDVISYFDPASSGTSINTHRVLEITEGEKGLEFHTKGDSNNAADHIPVDGEAIVGVYTGKRLGGAGTVAMFMQTTTGLIVCVVLPLMFLLGYDALRRYLYNKKHQSDKAALMAELEELRKLKAEIGEKE